MHRQGARSELGSAGTTLARAEAASVEAVEALFHRGVRSCIVGGLAVVHHGYGRATSDVDLMAVECHRVTGTPLGIPGVSITGWDVPVDVLFLDRHPLFMRDEVIAASQHTPPVLALEPLVFLKLSAGRAKDFADVVELLKVDMSRVEQVRGWLHQRRVERRLLERFERAASAASEELGL
jgi:hypothetical protein